MLTIIEKVLLLQNIELLSSVTTEQLSFLAAIAQEVSVESGKELYKENDPPDGLYVIVTGSVQMKRGGGQIDEIKAGGSFGVWALFDNAPRLTTAVSLEETRLLFVPRDDFYEVLSDHVDMVEGIFKHLVERIRKLATVAEP